MAHINKVVQPVVKTLAQRVDGVVDTGPVIPDWLDDSDLVGAYSLYDLYGLGNSIMQLSGQGGTQRIDFTQAEYENINSDGKGLPTNLTVVDKLYNQVPGSSNSDLSETAGNLSYRPSVAFRPYNRFDHVLFDAAGQYTGQLLSMSNLSNLSLGFDHDVTFIVVAQNNMSGNDPNSSYPFVAGFQYAESMGLSVDDDFRALTVVDTAGPMFMQARSHDNSISGSQATGSTSSYFVSSFGTYAGTFKAKNDSNNTCDERKMYSTTSSTADLVLYGTSSTDVSFLGTSTDTNAYQFLSVGARRGGFVPASNQDRIDMDFKALLVFKKVMTLDEINTVADGLRGVVL